MSATGWAAAAGARALLVVQDEAAAVATEAGRTVRGADGHHLQRVRRLGPAELVVVADGAGRWYPAVVTRSADGEVELARRGETVTEPVLAPRLTIAFAPARADHGAGVVHQLVELGVDAIVPLRSTRSVVRWDGARAEQRVERLRRVAREAAMQSHRARVPIVDEPAAPAHWRDHAAVVVGDRQGSAALAADLWAEPELVVLVGPEGGFGAEDLMELEHAPRFAVVPHTLRAVTAPVAIAAAIAGFRRA